MIDASTGQNGLVQAKQFADAVDVTGIVLTKLDGTAKGGIVLAIQSELGLPVKVVGVGEGVERPRRRSIPREFAAATRSTADDGRVASNLRVRRPHRPPRRHLLPRPQPRTAVGARHRRGDARDPPSRCSKPTSTSASSRAFIGRVKERAVGAELSKSLDARPAVHQDRARGARRRRSAARPASSR